jgi:hypothetical protein
MKITKNILAASLCLASFGSQAAGSLDLTWGKSGFAGLELSPSVWQSDMRIMPNGDVVSIVETTDASGYLIRTVRRLQSTNGFDGGVSLNLLSGSFPRMVPIDAERIAVLTNTGLEIVPRLGPTLPIRLPSTLPQSLLLQVEFDAQANHLLLRYENSKKLVALKLDGTLDPAFGSGGFVEFAQPIGKIIVQRDRTLVGMSGGYFCGNSCGRTAVASILSNGWSDLSFGGGGYVYGGNGDKGLIALRSDGGVVLAASTSAALNLYAFTATGTQNTAYGLNGVLSLPAFTSMRDMESTGPSRSGQIAESGFVPSERLLMLGTAYDGQARVRLSAATDFNVDYAFGNFGNVIFGSCPQPAGADFALASSLEVDASRGIYIGAFEHCLPTATGQVDRGYVSRITNF